MQRYDRIHQDKKEMLVNNFLGGIAWGLGATVGLALVLTTLGMISKQLDFVPVIGDFVSEIVSHVARKNPSLQG